MTRTPLKIETVVNPLPRCTLWSGTASTARRSYEWFYSPNDERQDGGRVTVRVNRPAGSDFWWNVRPTPSEFKAVVRKAVAKAQGGRA